MLRREKRSSNRRKSLNPDPKEFLTFVQRVVIENYVASLMKYNEMLGPCGACGLDMVLVGF